MQQIMALMLFVALDHELEMDRTELLQALESSLAIANT